MSAPSRHHVSWNCPFSCSGNAYNREPLRLQLIPLIPKGIAYILSTLVNKCMHGAYNCMRGMYNLYPPLILVYNRCQIVNCCFTSSPRCKLLPYILYISPFCMVTKLPANRQVFVIIPDYKSCYVLQWIPFSFYFRPAPKLPIRLVVEQIRLVIF